MSWIKVYRIKDNNKENSSKNTHKLKKHTTLASSFIFSVWNWKHPNLADDGTNNNDLDKGKYDFNTNFNVDVF